MHVQNLKHLESITYSMKEISSLLEICLLEDQLNDIITQAEDISLLEVAVQVKLLYVLQNRHEKIAFPIIRRLEIVTRDNCDKMCVVINASLLIQSDDVSLKCFLKHLNNIKSDNDEILYILVKLLTVAVSACETLNKLDLLREIFDGDFLSRLYLKVNNKRELQNCFITDVLSKYINLGICSKTAENLWNVVLVNRDLHILSCFIDAFMIVNNRNFDGVLVHLQDCLSNNTYYTKKLATYVLKKCVKYVSTSETNGNTRLEIMWGKTTNLDEFMISWRNFFILLEVLEEKQLHLIVPSLVLMKAVADLHPVWLLCVYQRMLMHSQNSVAFRGISGVLKADCCKQSGFFKSIVKYVLEALNKNDYSETYIQALDDLKLFACECSSDIFVILLTETLSITWLPTAVWCLLNSILNHNKMSSFSCHFIEAFARMIKRLPHKFIRDSCFDLMLCFICNNITSHKIFLKIAACVASYDLRCLPKYLHLTNNCRKFYHDNYVCDEINSWRNETYVNENRIYVVTKIIEHDESQLQKMLWLAKNREMDASTCDTIFLCLCERSINCRDVIMYLSVRVDEVTVQDDVSVLCEIVERLNCDVTDTDLCEKCLRIVLTPETFNVSQVRLAYKIHCLCCDSINSDVLKIWKSNFLKTKLKFDSDICRTFLRVYCKIRPDEESLREICDLFETVLDTQTEEVTVAIFGYLKYLMKSSLKDARVVSLIETSFSELCKFKKPELFKCGLSHYVDCMIQYVDVIEKNKEFGLYVTDTLGCLLSENDTAACVIADRFKNASETINLQFFVPLIVELLVYGGVFRKDERVEYEICKKIDELSPEENSSNPIFLGTSIRLAAVVTLLNGFKNARDDFCRTNIADALTSLLLQKYEVHYNKRYFPESQVHLQKLRIMQALLVIHKYICHERENLIRLLTNSFCVESHQSSIKQLMQWLLIELLQEDDNCLQVIGDKVNGTSRTHTSTIVAFIPVLFHISLRKDERFVERAVDTMLPWTMGAHFKLRLYSQVAIVKLMEASVWKNYTSILKKYGPLLDPLKSALEASDKEIQSVLQGDVQFLERFNPDRHFSIETLYVDFPRLNNVAGTEWETVNLDELPKDVHVRSRSEDRAFSRSICEKPIETKQANSSDAELFCHNIQKKIVPWKHMDDVDWQKLDLVLVTSLIDSPANLGGLSRTCEIYGVKQMVVSDGRVTSDKAFKSLSMSSENWVRMIEVKAGDLKDYLLKAKGNGYTLIGAEQTSASVKLNQYRFPVKCVLVLGNEREGISPTLLPFLDVCVEIPQFGVVRSLNVHVAGATFVWEYVKQHVLK